MDGEVLGLMSKAIPTRLLTARLLLVLARDLFDGLSRRLGRTVPKLSSGLEQEIFTVLRL